MTAAPTAERLAIKISSDRTTAEIMFLPASGVSGTLTVDADQLLALVQTLGSVRAEMVKNLPYPPLEGAEVSPNLNTLWYTQFDPLSERSMIAFQHAGFGPLAFLLVRQDAEKLANHLLQQTQIPPQSSLEKPN